MNKKEEFCKIHQIPLTSVIETSFAIPLIFASDITIEDVPMSLKGHPVLWMPEDIRIMIDNETFESYALRISSILYSLNYFHKDGGWVDVIYDKLLLDTESEVDQPLIKEALSNLTERESLIIVPNYYQNINREASQLAIRKVEEEIEESKKNAYTLFQSELEELQSLNPIQRKKDTFQDFKLAISEYGNTTKFQTVDSMQRDKIAGLVNNFIYWHAKSLQLEKQAAAEHPKNSSEYENVTKIVIRYTMNTIKKFKEDSDILEARFFGDNSKDSIVALATFLQKAL